MHHHHFITASRGSIERSVNKQWHAAPIRYPCVTRLLLTHNGPRRPTPREKKSGAWADRPELRRMIDWRARRATFWNGPITAAGASFKSLGEPWADTTTPAGKMVLTVFAGIAEFERALIRDRTGLGRIAAKERGVKFGRKPKLTPEQIVLAVRMVDEGQPVPQVADAFGVHETTIYRCLSTAEAAA